MPSFLFPSSVGVQGVSEPSKEKLKIQNIVETLCPRLCEGKVILQEIIWALTPGRCCKKLTQALAERAVEVTDDISHLLEGAKETSQLRDSILQLERTLRDICMFVQSETQRNLLHRMLFAKDLRVRYFSLDKQLRGLLKLFEQTVKKSIVLCAEPLSTTLQRCHSGVASQQDGTVAEIDPPNNSSAIHASGSIFHHANNTVVRDGTFYAAHNLTIQQAQDYDRTPGIVEGADVFTLGDVLPKKEIYKGRGYRVYSAHSTAKARAVKIKLYEGSCAKDRCLAAANFSQKVMHPNVLHLIGVSSLNSELPFLVFDESTEWAIESIIASALSKGLRQSLYLGLQTVAGISSGLDHLRSLLYPFASVGLDHFVVSYSHHGNILLSFDPEVLPDETHGQGQRSGASDGGNELDIFHRLCQHTFDAACKVHYESQIIQRSDVDEVDADYDLDQDRFEEFEVDAGTLPVDIKDPTSDVSSLVPSAPQLHAALPTASRRPPRKSISSARRWELVWKSQKNETFSLNDIARQFQSFLLTFSTDLGFNRRRGRYTTKTAHRCPGYNRIEITLTPDIARSAIVSHLTPTPHEICPVCKETVKDAEIFACICGCDDNESIPNIRCSTCSEWHHRPCISMSEHKDQSFVCQRCKIQTKPEPNKPDSFGHFTKDAEIAYARCTQTAESSPRNIMSSRIHPAFDPIHQLVGTATLDSNPTRVDAGTRGSPPMLALVQEAATLDSNPSMKQAAEIALKIFQKVQFVKDHRTSFQRLADDVVGLITRIWKAYQELPADEKQNWPPIAELVLKLEPILDFVEEQVKRSKTEHIWNSRTDSGKIQEYRDRVHGAIRLFEINHPRINDGVRVEEEKERTPDVELRQLTEEKKVSIIEEVPHRLQAEGKTRVTDEEARQPQRLSYISYGQVKKRLQDPEIDHQHKEEQREIERLREIIRVMEEAKKAAEEKARERKREEKEEMDRIAAEERENERRCESEETAQQDESGEESSSEAAKEPARKPADKIKKANNAPTMPYVGAFTPARHPSPAPPMFLHPGQYPVHVSPYLWYSAPVGQTNGPSPAMNHISGFYNARIGGGINIGNVTNSDYKGWRNVECVR